MKRHASLSLLAVLALSAARPAVAGPAAPEAAPSVDSLMQRAAAEAAAGKHAQALEFVREAYRLEPSPLLLYDLGVLHDHLGACDDAAFFYRAALWGKGVLAADVQPVQARLNVLEDQCHYSKRHVTVADRHARAARYLELRFCALAKSILTGIATAKETAEVQACTAASKRPPAP